MLANTKNINSIGAFDATQLEFDVVKRKLAALTGLPMSNEAALDLDVVCDGAEIQRRQDETAEALNLLQNGVDLRLGGVKDPRPYLQRLELGGALSGAELIDLAYILDDACKARALIGRNQAAAPTLAGMARQIGALESLVRNVRSMIAENGEVKSSASRLLRTLRQRVAQAYQHLIARLSKLMENRHLRAYLQSNSITTRNNRLCVEVKSEHRHELAGIVHGVSATSATVFLEPLALVRLGNDWRELEAQAHSEERRILNALSDSMAAHLPTILQAVGILTHLDFCFAKGKLARAMNAVRPQIARASSKEPFCELKDARHPLLGDNAVASDIKIGPRFRGLVITGPNAGGKTVTLKTIGLAALMHQAGLHIAAADKSALRLFDNVFAGIGDGQNIANSISTFSAHIATLKNIVERSGKNSLALLDELCSSTDPQEGAALACAILNHLVDKRAVVVATTHYSRVAEFAAQSEQLENASVELELKTLKPTYRLQTGTPGRSYALELARDMRLNPAIINAARGLLDSGQSDAGDLLARIQRRLDEAESIKARAAEAERAALTAQADAERTRDAADSHIQYLEEQARRELRRKAAKVERQLNQVVRDATQTSDADAAKRAVSRIRGDISEPTWTPVTTAAQNYRRKHIKNGKAVASVDQLQIGDTVLVTNLSKTGQIVNVNQNGKIGVQVGKLLVSANFDRLIIVNSNAPKPLK